MFVATIGLDIESGTPRMTFDQVELLDGVPLLAITVGMLALSEMVIQAEELFSQRGGPAAAPVRTDARGTASAGPSSGTCCRPSCAPAR